MSDTFSLPPPVEVKGHIDPPLFPKVLFTLSTFPDIPDFILGVLEYHPLLPLQEFFKNLRVDVRSSDGPQIPQQQKQQFQSPTHEVQKGKSVGLNQGIRSLDSNVCI